MSRRVLHPSYERIDKRAEHGRRRGNSSSFPWKKVSRGKLARECTEDSITVEINDDFRSFE